MHTPAAMSRAVLLALAIFSLRVMAASAVDTVAVDLDALIRQAADNPAQFAVNVPHAVAAGPMRANLTRHLACSEMAR